MNKLQQLTPEERLAAAVWYYTQVCPEHVSWIRLGFDLAQEDGWKKIALAWVEGEHK